MLFYEELSHFLTIDRFFASLYAYVPGSKVPTTEGGAGWPQDDKTMECLESCPQGQRAQSVLLEVFPQNSGLMVLVPRISQDLAVQVHLQLDLSSLIIFSGMVKQKDHSMQDHRESSNAMVIGPQDLEPDPMPITLLQFCRHPTDHG